MTATVLRLALAAGLGVPGALKLAAGCAASDRLTAGQVCAIAAAELLAAVLCATRWWPCAAALACGIGAGGVVLGVVAPAPRCGCLGDAVVAWWGEGALAAALGLCGSLALATGRRRRRARDSIPAAARPPG